MWGWIIKAIYLYQTVILFLGAVGSRSKLMSRSSKVNKLKKNEFGFIDQKNAVPDPKQAGSR